MSMTVCLWVCRSVVWNPARKSFTAFPTQSGQACAMPGHRHRRQARSNTGVGRKVPRVVVLK
eukprot:256177-Prymnesium_polylepis.1